MTFSKSGLAQFLDISRPTLNKHLKTLKMEHIPVEESNFKEMASKIQPLIIYKKQVNPKTLKKIEKDKKIVDKMKDPKMVLPLGKTDLEVATELNIQKLNSDLETIEILERNADESLKIHYIREKANLITKMDKLINTLEKIRPKKNEFDEEDDF